MKQPSLEVVIEIAGETRYRPVFIPNGMSNQSWVGEWTSRLDDLSKQVAKEFSQWVTLETRFPVNQ